MSFILVALFQHFDHGIALDGFDQVHGSPSEASMGWCLARLTTPVRNNGLLVLRCTAARHPCMTEYLVLLATKHGSFPSWHPIRIDRNEMQSVMVWTRT